MKTATTKKKSVSTKGRRPAIAKPSTAGARMEFPVDPSFIKMLDREARRVDMSRSQLVVAALKEKFTQPPRAKTAR